MECILEPSQLRSSGGQCFTQGLFYEFRHQTSRERGSAPYTLKEYDWKGARSMYKIYMSCASEYEAAQKLLGSWKHWNILCEIHWFKKNVEAWREERQILEAAIGKITLIEQAKEGNVSAAKELVNQEKRKGAGRPTKLEVEAEKKRQAAVDTKVSSLMERMQRV